jgi:hypothetical protein
MAMKDYLCQYNYSILIKILKISKISLKNSGVLQCKNVNSPFVVENGQFLAVQNGKIIQGGQDQMVVNIEGDFEIIYEKTESISYYSLNEQTHTVEHSNKNFKNHLKIHLDLTKNK